jgi:LysM repeat protein
LSESYKVCPICKTHNHPNALVCSTCGTSLATIDVVKRPTNQAPKNQSFDFRYGETDLLETTLNKNARGGLLILGVMSLVMVLVIGVFIGSQINRNQVVAPVLEATLTPRPTLILPTVTLGPPTATYTFTPLPTFTPTITNTPAPCIQRIVAGGSLIGAITSCGYTNLDVMQEVMELNGITDPGALREGQEIIIPWPTPTFDPNRPTETPRAGASSNGIDPNLLSLNQDIVAFAAVPTATLPPGLTWYVIQSGDTMISVAVDTDTNAKTLSEINPEIEFLRCEFGERFGGSNCIVNLSPGQQMRVPAPLPTATLSPTPDPNSTATPTPTPTFNAPNSQSPFDKQFFADDELISLRWAASATLQTGQAYRVDVTNLTTNTSYYALTQDLFFLIPTEWQGTEDARFNYSWTVGIIDQTNPEVVYYKTAPLTFVWQGVPQGQ